jgi:hypothetical protein
MNDYLKTVRAACSPYNFMPRSGDELSKEEVAEVARLVHAGGAVNGTVEQIEGRVRNAHLFVIALQANEIVGVAAFKAPQQ